MSPSAQSQTLCAFCAIVAGNAPAELIESTPDVLAFLDQRPVFKGHVLVIPRRHVVTITDLPPASRDPFLAGIQRIAAAITSGLGAQGSFVAMNNVVSQSVPHLHCHVVPRTKGDGLRGFFWPRVRYDSAEEMREYAARLRAVL